MRLSTRLQILGALLVILATKWLLIDKYGTSLPFFDAWFAEANATFKPAAAGQLGWHNLWAAHNEHHIVLTKLWALFWLEQNGQWDNLLVATANTFLHVAALGGLLWLLQSLIAGWRFTIIVTLVVILAALPVTSENTLYSFQSQFYLLLGTSILYLFGSVSAISFRPTWWVAQVSGVLMLGTMAAAPLAPLAVIIGVLLSGWYCHRLTRVDVATLGIAILLAAVGFWVVNPIFVQDHAPLHTHSFTLFLTSFAANLAWPTTGRPWLAVLLQAPLFIWAIRTWRTGNPTPTDWGLASLGMWHGLQCAAIAFARGNLELGLAGRYNDIHLIGIIVNATCLVLLTGERRGRYLLAAVAALWIVFLGWGLNKQRISHENYFLHPLEKRNQIQTEHMRAFLATGDRAAFLAGPEDAFPLPITMAKRLADILEEPAIREIMPASVRPPVPLRPDAASAEAWEEKLYSPPNLTERRLAWVLRDPQSPAPFTSQPLEIPTGHFLTLRVSGKIGTRTQPLALVNTEGESSFALLDREVGNRWKNTNILVTSPGPHTLSTPAPLPGASLAFTSPVEVGYYSWLARKVRGSANGIAFLGLVLFAGATIALVLIPPRGRRAPTGSA